MRYKIELLFGNRAYLASVDDAMLKKLVILFLFAYNGEFDEGEFNERVSLYAGGVFDQISERKIVEDLSLDTTQDLISAICTERVQPCSDQYKAYLAGILGKIFRKIVCTRGPPIT